MVSGISIPYLVGYICTIKIPLLICHFYFDIGLQVELKVQLQPVFEIKLQLTAGLAVVLVMVLEVAAVLVVPIEIVLKSKALPPKSGTTTSTSDKKKTENM